MRTVKSGGRKRQSPISISARAGQALAAPARHLCKIWWDASSYRAPDAAQRTRVRALRGPSTGFALRGAMRCRAGAHPGAGARIAGSRFSEAALRKSCALHRARDTRPLFRESIRPALLDAALERRPRMHALQPRGEIRIRPDPVEHFCHLGDKAHLDIRACQRVADKELAPLQRALDI